MINQTDNLVIFDYSGTLSPEAPKFGRSDNLARALTESGLSSLGVTSPNFFWKEIVDPTWMEGSTTASGYKRVMTERIMALGLDPGKTGPEIAAAASRFVESYLDHSRIDPHWRPILEKLAVRPEAALVIATDHYAEITETIIRYLRSWNIRAQKAQAETALPGRPAPVAVANSADIGFWKADRRFWEILMSRLVLETVRSVLIIDDFGFNEEQGDGYGEWARVEARQAKTVTVLGDVFGAEVKALPFLLKDRERQETADLISETGERIDGALDDPGRAR